MCKLFNSNRYRRTTHTGSAYSHEYTFVFTRIHAIPSALCHQMGCVKLISNLFRTLLITRAKNVTRNFSGITLNMPFHKNPPDEECSSYPRIESTKNRKQEICRCEEWRR